MKKSNSMSPMNNFSSNFSCKMISRLCLYISIFAIVACRNIDREELDALIGVIENFYSNTRVLFHSCIERDDAVKLSRTVSRRQISHSVFDNLEGFDRKFHDNREHRNLYALDLQCDYSLDALDKANMKKMFVAPTKWLLMMDNRDGNTSNDLLIKTFNNLDIYPDSEVLIMRRLSSDFFNLVSIYKPSAVRDLVIENFGNWSSDDGNNFEKHVPSSERRKNLQKTPLKSCLVMTDSNTANHLTDYLDERVDAVTKATYPWVLHLVSRMNATISFDVEDTWGYENSNGSWNGMIGKLQRNEIDIGGTAAFLVSDRIDVVDYVQLYARTGLRFIFRQPLLSSVSNIFTQPFERSVWIAIGLFLACVIALLYVSMKWEYNLVFNDESANYWRRLNPIKPSFSDNLLVIIGAVAQQGFSYEPYRVPSRIITLVLLLAALSLYTSYTANIVSLLQATTNSIKTLADLLNSPLKLGVQDIVYNRHFFKVFNDPIRKAISDKVRDVKGRKSNWMTMEEGVRRLKNELFAFHGEFGTVYQIMQDTFLEEEKCGITELDYLNILYPLLIIKKRSPYNEIIRVGSLKIWESGLQAREHARLWTKKPICYGHTNFVSIGITECYFALLIMCYGTILAIFIFLLEHLWKRRQAKDVELFLSELNSSTSTSRTT